MRISKLLRTALLFSVLGLFFSCGKSDKTEQKYYTKLEDFESDGVCIGLQTGTVYADVIKSRFPKAEIKYFTTVSDLTLALDSGIIQGIVNTLESSLYIEDEVPFVSHIPEVFDKEDIAFAFHKDDEGERLCDEISEFIRYAKSSHIMDIMVDAWFNNDPSKQMTGVDSLTGERGVLEVAVEASYEPFCYLRDGKIVGFDIDLLIRFAQEKGYKININNMNFDAVIPSLQTTCNIAASGITKTDERSEAVLFSEAYHSTDAVMMVKKPVSKAKRITSFGQLKAPGVRLGIQTGSFSESVAMNHFPKAERKYFASVPDMVSALEADVIDGFVCQDAVAGYIENALHSVTLVKEGLDPVDVAFAFPKNEEGRNISEKVSEFIKKAKMDGTMDTIADAWFHDNRKNQVTDVKSLTGERGVLDLAAGCGCPPFCFVRDDETVGFDIDLLIRFCREYGYRLNIHNMDLDAVIPSLQNMCNIAAGGISMTDGKNESLLFCEPYCQAENVVVVRKNNEVNAGMGFSSLVSSFEKSFVKEGRWKLILKGISTTIFISVFSIILGSLLGFVLCLLLGLNKKSLNMMIMFFVRIMQGTPQLVFLMILFYIVFAKSGIAGEIVAIIAFAVNLSAYTSMIFKSGIDSIDKGQTEAALALGCTKTQAFIKIILPQALARFLPVYKGEVISLVKATSIVGYIAVQDLTKMSDIIRSRTYEAFFPLIMSALIYLVISVLLTSLLQFVEIKIKPKRTVKGVEVK